MWTQGQRYYPMSLGQATCTSDPWWYLAIAAAVGFGVGYVTRKEKKGRRGGG